MNKLDKNGLTVNTISKTDGTDVFDEIDSKITLEEASENFLSLNGGTVSGNITFEKIDTESRNIGFKPTEGANAIFYTVTNEDDNLKGRFAIGAADGTTMTWLTGTSNGNLSWNGSKVITNSSLTDLENNLHFTDNSGSRAVGYKAYEGARITFYSGNNSNDSDKGRFVIAAQKDADNTKYLIGKPDGTLTWNGVNIVTYGLLNRLDTSIVWTTDSRTSGTIGFNSIDGAKLIFYNKNHTTHAGYFQLLAGTDSTSCSLSGKPDGTLTWGGSKVYTANNFTGGASTIATTNLTASKALVSDSSGKVAASDITSTELGYLDGVTSNIQTQLNAKQASISGGASTIATTNLTASRALISNSSGKVTVSAVTSTELGYLDGVTSNVQTQLNAKQASISGGASTITSSNLTASRALISNSSGKVAVSAVTSTELGYLDGVTSSIQTQINNLAKYPKYTASEWKYNVLTTNGGTYTTTGNGYLLIATLTDEWVSCMIGSLSFMFTGDSFVLLPIAKGVVIKREASSSTVTGAVEISMIYPS